MDKSSLAERIGQLRGRETQARFGKRFKVTRQTVMRWEKGETIPPPEVLEKLGICIEYVEASERTVERGEYAQD
jgi:DNA-binding XRE family transcriptional regulator